MGADLKLETEGVVQRDTAEYLKVAVQHITVTPTDAVSSEDLVVDLCEPRVQPSLSMRSTIEKRAASWYARGALVSDILAILTSTLAVFVLRPNDRAENLPNGVSYVAVAFGIAVTWILILALSGCYDRRMLGVGTDELRRIVVATMVTFGVVAITSYLLMAQVSRGFIIVTLPIGLAALLAGRLILRSVLHRRRLRGQDLNRTLVVGDPRQSDSIEKAFSKDPRGGYVAVAQMDPPNLNLDSWIDALNAAVEKYKLDAIALSMSDRITDEVVRRLSWKLEGQDVDLLVSPVLGDIAGPRITFRPAAGLPLIHLDEPHLTGPKRFAKRLLDVLMSAVALIVLSPVMVLTAIAIKSSSRGPIIFRQTRVGQSGESFSIIKFRTMIPDAATHQSEVWALAAEEGMASKSKRDPRLTPVGSFLRRWSLDELPQLFNVLGGSMSMVGPRPLQRVEAESLSEHADRRHLSRPGITGLWQVSGRSDTTWDERMRLDLYYVENWSPALDVVILLKTAKAVISGTGAY